MTHVEILHDDGDMETIIPDPEFVDCLFNTREVAVDGETYSDVVQVTYSE